MKVEPDRRRRNEAERWLIDAGSIGFLLILFGITAARVGLFAKRGRWEEISE